MSKAKEDTKKTDLYGMLHVRPDAPTEVIEAAYEALSKTEIKGKKSSLNYKIKLDLAKDILCDKKKREKYDAEYYSKTPDILGDYIILEEIGEGGFANTYKAENRYSGGLACIKHCLHLTPEKEKVLMKEAKALWDLRHHAIPSIRSIVKEDDGNLALIMSYIEGPTLEQIIDKHGSLDPEHVCWITQRVLDALKYLHFNGVVHGDVNPKNIIIQPDIHSACLVDYGLATIKPSKDKKNAGHTPYFSPPEQIDGNPLLPESDFYSLGMTMMYALGGDIMNKQVPGDVPDPLCDFIADLIAQDVLARPNWMKEDLIESMQGVRKECFGRTRSDMKKLPKV